MTKRHRPSLPELGDALERFGGSRKKVAQFYGYSKRSVDIWIDDAQEDIKIGLLEIEAKAKAAAKQAKLRRQELGAFIIPGELKPLVSLYYRLSWAELNQLEIAQVLELADQDPDQAQALRVKLTWEQVAKALDPLADVIATRGSMHIKGWDQHVLYCWVGLSEKSPLWEHWDQMPDPSPADTEETVRAVIQKLSQFL